MYINRYIRATFLFVMVGFFAFAPHAFAATRTWSGTTSVAWTTATNWAEIAVPASGDDVIINGSNGQSMPTLDLSGGDVTINSLTLGNSSTSVLTLSNGGTSTKRLITTVDVTVGGNGTLTHTANSSAQTHSLSVNVGGNLTVSTGGKIDATGRGFSAGNGIGAGGYDGCCGHYGGAGHGGGGGKNFQNNGAGGGYGSTTVPTTLGSGSGDVSGGGAIRVNVSGTATVNGQILANGSANVGGASGGSIWMTVGTLTGTGGIGANGGSTVDISSGSGGGGRIALYYTTNTYTGTTTTFGGSTGFQKAGAGTIFTKLASAANGDLFVDNNNTAGVDTTVNATSTFDNITISRTAQYVIPSGYTITMASSSITGSSSAALTVSAGAFFTASALTSCTNTTIVNNGTSTVSTPFTIGNGCTWNENKSTSTTFTDLTVASGGVLTHSANASTLVYSINTTLTNLTVDVGGKVDVTSKGYAAGSGSGAGGYDGCCGHYGGAGHGGGGGINSFSNGAGVTYGSSTAPITLGSGSGGPAGGGLVKMTVSGTATVNGQILANGGASTGGGSGGSIWLTVGTLAGTGGIGANGGATTDLQSGGGGGGRVALYYTTKTYTGTTTAFGGAGSSYQQGGAGTIFTKAAGAANGDLLVDNNGIAGANSTVTGTTTVDNLTISRAAQYVLPSGYTITMASSSITGSTTAGLTINSGAYFTASALTSCTNLAIYNNGTTTVSTPFTIGNGCTWNENKSTSTTFTDLTVASGGVLTHTANAGTLVYSINTTLTNLNIATGGKIDVTGKGYAAGSGSGAGGYDGCCSHYGGAGYGGNGGNHLFGSGGGATYGSATMPMTLGSGSGNVSGGGVVQLIITGTTTINGQILANGAASTGGGSGGSIWLTTVGLAGTGGVGANGGSTVDGNSGSGGGGRIALYYTYSTFTGTTTAFGGTTGTQKGGAGTIFTKLASQPNGDLVVDNNSVSGANTTVLSTTTVNNLTIKGSAVFVSPPQLNIAGNYINNATFTAGTGTTTFNGTGVQTATGTMTGVSAFRNLVITNNTATTTFIATATTNNNFFINTPNVRVQFKPGGTTTLQNLIILGSAGSEVYLFSSTSGSRWNLYVPGTRSISYAKVQDSDACSSAGNIDASNGTNIDGGNDRCWTFSNPPVLTLVHYRWRMDNESEVSAGYYTTEDTALAGRLYTGDRVRLRMLVENTGAGAATNYNFRLEYASSSCSAWSALSPQAEWFADLSQYVPETSPTTNAAGLTDPGGLSFLSGTMLSGTSSTGAFTLPANQFTEDEFVINSTASVSANLVYCFRLTNAGSITNFIYSVQPQLQLRGGGHPQSGGGGSETNGVGPQRSGGSPGGGTSTDGTGTGGIKGGGTPSGGGGDSG